MSPCENQLLPGLGPKKSPARTTMTLQPWRLAACRRCSICTRMAPLLVSGSLGRIFPQHGEGAGAKVVDRAGQHDGGANGLCGGDGVVHHGQHQLAPSGGSPVG